MMQLTLILEIYAVLRLLIGLHFFLNSLNKIRVFTFFRIRM